MPYRPVLDLCRGMKTELILSNKHLMGDPIRSRIHDLLIVSPTSYNRYDTKPLIEVERQTYLAEQPDDGEVAESVSNISCSELSSFRRLSSVVRLMPLSASSSRPRPTPLHVSVMLSSSSSMHSYMYTHKTVKHT